MNGNAEAQTAKAHVFADGSAEAPRGSPLLPNLLAGYAARPPWKVAGVDYAVGVPAGTILRDPATIVMPGVSIDVARHFVSIDKSNVTLSGYDFGLSGGWGIVVQPGVTNTVIENSSFHVGLTNLVPIHAYAGAGDLSIQNNTFDGGGGTSGVVWALIYYLGSGTFAAKYNSFLNAPADAIDFGGGTMTTIVDYNVFHNLGTAPGAHADTVQYVGTNSTNAVIAFNTVTSGEEGIQLAAQNHSTLINSAIENNVVVAKGPPLTMSYSIAVQQASGNKIDSVVVAGNYIDCTGAYGPFYTPTGSRLAFVGNVNMTTGSQIPSPPGTASSDVDSVTVSPATGSATAGTNIMFSLRMVETEFVTGTPTLTLNNGGTAVYTSGSGSNTLVFRYTVGENDGPAKNLAISHLNIPAGAEVLDAAGSRAILTALPQSASRLTVTTRPANREP